MMTTPKEGCHANEKETDTQTKATQGTEAEHTWCVLMPWSDHVEPPDGDARDMGQRIARLQVEIAELGAEALRVRDQHREQIDALKNDVAALAELRRLDVPVPLNVIEWARAEVHRLPNARDEYRLGLGDVLLGDLRSWVAAIDKG